MSVRPGRVQGAAVRPAVTATAVPPSERPAAGPAEAPATPRREPLGAQFRVHLAGVSLANLADGIVAAGVPLIAVGLTRSPAEISLLSVAFWLPWLLLGIVAGLVVDRSDRRRVQLAGMAVRAVLLVALTVAAVRDALTMPLLIGAVLAYGVTQVFIDLAATSMVPTVVVRSRLSAANGRVLASEQVFQAFVGAPVGGLLLVLGAGWVMGVPAALAVLFLLTIGLGLRGRSYREEREHAAPALTEIGAGLSFLLRHPVLRPFMVSGSLINMVNTGYFAVFVLWVVGEGSAVGLSPQGYPLLLALLAVGAVAGSLSVERLTRRFREVPVLLTCWTLNALTLLVPALWPHPVPIGAAMLVLGATNTVGNVLSMTIRQRLVAPAMLGRVGGAGRTLGFGLMPLGALLGGLAAEAWGLQVVFVGTTAVALLALVYPATRVTQDLVDRHELPG